MTATLGVDHEGRVYEVPDTEHNTGQIVKLRVVRNSTGATITAARRGCEFRKSGGGTTMDYGRKIGAFGNNFSAQGIVGKPLDDAYTAGVTILENDLFYVVESGPCTIEAESVVVSLPAGTAVTWDAAGQINGARAAAGEYVVGTIDEACSTPSAEVIVLVNEGLDNASA